MLMNSLSKNTKNMDNGTTEVAVFAGGCFWCTEAVFRMLRGVESVESGYTVGKMTNPTYEQVCEGVTGHAEAIRIIFDPSVISYQSLLTVFFATHDPTTLNRQGNDVGTQYRSAIFYMNDQQKQLAETYIAELQASSTDGDPIVTTIEPLGEFYPAEDYHQRYFERNGGAPYCSLIIAPKVAKAQERFAALLASQVQA